MGVLLNSNTDKPQIKPVLLVTGGGRGIGAATARLAAQRGYRVAFSYRRDEVSAQRVLEDIQHDGGEAIALQADMAEEQQIIALFDEVMATYGRLDVLINNAGIVDTAMPLKEMSMSRMQRMMQINVVGVMLCCREAIKRMSTRNGGFGGAIVNVGSAAAHRGSPNEYVDYAASKGAIDSLTEGLAKELAADGIRVNTVRPGVIDTQIHIEGGRPDKARQAEGRIPMGRAGRPEEIAHALLWLASGEASFTTGAILDVDGGV